MIRNKLDLFREAFISNIPAGKSFEIEEKDESGRGCCMFQGRGQVILIKPPVKELTLWSLKIQTRAEAAFIVTLDDATTHLHIVEIKSKIKSSTLKKVVEQWRGMYFSSLAVLGVAQESHPNTVTVYLAFTDDAVEIDPAQITTNKVLTGGERLNYNREWKTKRIKLSDNVIATIIGAHRTPDFDFGVIGAGSGT